MTQPRALLLLAIVFCAFARADDSLTVAVASNFIATAEEIADAFSTDSGITVRLSGGSTGKLYAQIVNGAPYDIFLSADMERPRLLGENGLADPDSLYAYAEGMLVLVSSDPSLKGLRCLEALRNSSYRKIAIANPKTAPYGAAAKSYLQAQGYWNEARSRLVMGENILQTFQFVATGNATLGIVAASQLARDKGTVDIACRSAITMPATTTLFQGGVILKRTQDIDSAQSFMKFLSGEQAERLILKSGYKVPVN